MSDRAYVLIRNKILRGEFALGAPLSRRNLAAELEMSFVPISEAMQRLEAEGLVESRPRVGTRVRVPTPQDLRDRYIIREALETQSARLFCEKASSAEREEMRRMAARLDEMSERWTGGEDDPDFVFSVQSFHLSLHMRIAECTGCGPLCELIEKNQVLAINWLYDMAAGYQLPPGFHQPLIELLAGNDPDAADAAMRKHVRSGMQEILAAISERYGAGGGGLQGPEVLGEAVGAALWRSRYRRSADIASRSRRR
ncbi:MAG: GntR family transcriptional regulator [Acidobacteria bacterium]|nr:GntR family transcriptional regulator [Acidobacteriota bacterium]